MTGDPLGELLRLLRGPALAEEAAPILAALDDRAGFAPEDAPDAPPPPAGPGSEPPGGFGSNPPPSFAPGDASRAERGGGPSILRIEVTDAGRQVVNLRLPIAVGKFALDRIPGLPAEQVSRVREALRSGYRGSVLEVDDDGDGVRIVLE